MKKIQLYSIIIALLVGIASCGESELLRETASQKAVRELIVTASIADNNGTRVTVVPDGTNITDATWVSAWETTDRLGAWVSGTERQLPFAIVENSFGGTNDKNASFAGSIPTAASQICFFYPCDVWPTISGQSDYPISIASQLFDANQPFYHYGKSRPMVSPILNVNEEGTVDPFTLRNLCVGMEYRLWFTNIQIHQSDIRIVKVELLGAQIANSGALTWSSNSFASTIANGSTDESRKVTVRMQNSPKLNDYNENTNLYSMVGNIFPFVLPKDGTVTLRVYTNYGYAEQVFTATNEMNFALGAHHYITMGVDMSNLTLFTDSDDAGNTAGSKTNPYLIANKADLERLATEVNSGISYIGKYFKVTNDINLEGSSSNGWTLIGNTPDTPFEATLMGDGKTISNLYCDGSISGLFGYIGANGAVEDLNVSGTVVCSGGAGGGIAANNAGHIVMCSFSGTVKGNTTIGGIAGMSSGQILGCSNFAKITRNPDNTLNSAGGIAGSGVGKISVCRNKGAVGESNYIQLEVGGITGGGGYSFSCYTTYSTVSDNYCYSQKNDGGVIIITRNETSTDIVIGTGTGPDLVESGEFTATQMKDGTMLAKLNEGLAKVPVTYQGKTLSWVAGVDGYPIPQYDSPFLYKPEWQDVAAESYSSGTGNQNDPYLITTPQQLAKLAKDVNSGTTYSGVYFKLGTNIDLSHKKWTAIGSNITPFNGKFDGNGKKIVGLTIEKSDAEYQGLFGYIENAEVKNLQVAGTIKGKNNVGGIAGYNFGSTISGCSFSGSVSGNNYIGGICGYSDSYSYSYSSITACYNTGSVTGGDNSNIGGICGYSYSSSFSSSSITACYNTGSVTGGDNSNIGGICGYSYSYSSSFSSSSITACYNTGSVTGKTNSNIGGILGKRGHDSFVKYSYCLESKKGETNAIGVTIYNVSGGAVENVSPLSEAQMKGQATFKNDEDKDVSMIDMLLKESDKWIARTDNYPWLGF